MPEPYPFTEGYQLKLVALLFRDSNFLPANRHVMRAHYFDRAPFVELCRLALSWYDRERMAPTADAMSQMVMDRVDKLDDTEVGPLVETFEKALRCDLSEAADVTLRAREFAVNQELIVALTESLGDIKAGNPQQVRVRVEEALKTGADHQNMGLFPLESFEWMTWNRVEHAIPTGLELLDKHLDGGWAPGELVVICAATGFGKTWACINHAKWALLRGMDVVHISLEMPEAQVAWRYSQVLLDMARTVARSAPAQVEDMLRTIREKLRNHLNVRQMYGSGATIEAISSHLSVLEAQGKIRRGKLLLVIDYPCLLLCSQRFNQRHEQITQNYLDCRNLAIEWAATCLGPIQGNRDSYTKTVLTPRDFAGAFDVAADADIGLAVCQTDREKAVGLSRYFLWKARDGDDGKTVVMHYDPEVRLMRQALRQDSQEILKELGSATTDEIRARVRASVVAASERRVPVKPGQAVTA